MTTRTGGSRKPRRFPQPPAPWMFGQCFDAAALVFLGRLYWLPPDVRNIRLCHGLGRLAGEPAAHAWLEGDHRGKRRAFDVNWWTITPATEFRRQWGFTIVHEFDQQQAFFFWALFDMPGPWDPRLLEITERVSRSRGSGP